MTNKQFAIVGFLAPTTFWLTYLVMANQRPAYSFLTKAISELGSIDAPNKWTWNILGYILTGVLISIFSFGLFKNIKTDTSNKLPFNGIFLSGVFMAISGIFPGDFENKESLTMLLHTIGSFGSYIFFLIGAFTFPKQMKKTAYWTTAIKPTLFLTWLTILFGSWAFIFPSFPAVGQRIVFAFYFLWIFFTAYKLYNQTTKIKTTNH
jgi:hypothetical membrane protein